MQALELTFLCSLSLRSRLEALQRKLDSVWLKPRETTGSQDCRVRGADTELASGPGAVIRTLPRPCLRWGAPAVLAPGSPAALTSCALSLHCGEGKGSLGPRLPGKRLRAPRRPRCAHVHAEQTVTRGGHPRADTCLQALPCESQLSTGPADLKANLAI